MVTVTRTSTTAVLALIAGVASLCCGILVLASKSDSYLIGIVLSGALALVLGVYSRIKIWRSNGRLRGKGFATWGMGMPLGGFALGFLLLPGT